MKKIIIVAIAVGLLLLIGCSKGTTVSRTEADKVTDLSGYWNESDARFVAEQMVMDLLNRPWLAQYSNQHNRNPVVIVGNIRNRTSEHIDSGMFVKDIERELINSGKVRFVAASDERKQLIEERYHQQSHAAEETAASLAQETGADFMLIGTMTSSIDSSGGKSTRFYQVDMELINIENNEKVWMGQKQIKKEVGRARTSW